MADIRLVALDLDGTLFNSNSQISQANLMAIQDALFAGVHVVISTGRPYQGLPLSQLKTTGMKYAITTNGAGIYQIPDHKLISENSMEPELILPILDFLMSKDIHMDAFIGGAAYTPVQCIAVGKRLPKPPSIKRYILQTRVRKEDLPGYIRRHPHSVQKMTMNFYPDEHGILVDREEVRTYLEAHPGVECVCGGYSNLEFTKAGVDKGMGLRTLADYLQVPMECTMAIGDSENDLSILKAAALGIAMANAPEDIKQAADAITLSNDEDGVAHAIRKYVLS